MNAYLTINPDNQDGSLAGAFDAAMIERKWKINKVIPLLYTKKFKAGLSEKEIKTLIKKDLNDAVYDAEWLGLPYSFVLSENSSVNAKTK